MISGELELERLDELSDEDAIAELVAVKGLGLWTAQMFLMFHLDRPDVLPVGDLGIRRAIERAYGLEGLPDAATMERIAEPWRPYRTLACRYLWRSLRTSRSGSVELDGRGRRGGVAVARREGVAHARLQEVLVRDRRFALRGELDLDRVAAGLRHALLEPVQSGAADRDAFRRRARTPRA